MKRVCVVGGGAAGLAAAYSAAKNGNEVILIEKNEKLGKKLYITGKGRCNFTNDCSAEDFLSNVVRGEKFLKGCIYSTPPQKIMQFFEDFGLSIKVERGNRVFPSSDHASDVTKTLEKACKSEGATIYLNENVLKINTTPRIITLPDIDNKEKPSCASRIVSVETTKRIVECDVCVVATGGVSYPTTGSTGDGYRFAESVGHSIVELKPALCGFELSGNLHAASQGVSLKNVSLTVMRGQTIIFNELGEALFTHFGVSGPLVLSASSLINRLNLNELEIFFDFKPALDENTLDKRLLRDFEKFKNKKISNALIELLPQKLIDAVLSVAKIPESRNVNVLTKGERAALVKALKRFPLRVRALRDFKEAIVTSGGVDLSEINPKTMESKKVSGLKFCGEVLDVDAFTGGFNLQIAFATGFAAGSTIKE